MSNAEMERNKKRDEWLKTRSSQDLLGALQGLFMCAEDGTSELKCVYVNAKTMERDTYDLTTEDFHGVALELYGRLTDAEEELEELKATVRNSLNPD